jgi:5-oxoprolinase (ATP-hydrolysing) subunit A
MAPTMKIDLNCDLGESFGRYSLGEDAAMMALITSANVACGFHAGDFHVMAHTVGLAVEFGVALGAHPGYPDLQGFGRRMMSFSPEEIIDLVIYQLGALSGFAQVAGIPLVHVKPHGALYNQSAKDKAVAEAIAEAVKLSDPGLILVGLAGSLSVIAGQEAGLHVANEGFPDRAYLPDGQLMPRSQPGAVLTDPNKVAVNALRLAKEGIIIAGQRVEIDTLCLHGDNPEAVENAKAVRRALETDGIVLEPLGY